MSNAATLPDPQTAYNTLFDEVHSEIFFRKCAAAGIHPESAEDAQIMLETAGRLRAVKQAEAAPPTSVFRQLKTAADQLFGAHAPQAARHEQEQSIKAAADAILSDPKYYNAVLSVKAADAQAIRKQLGA